MRLLTYGIIVYGALMLAVFAAKTVSADDPASWSLPTLGPGQVPSIINPPKDWPDVPVSWTWGGMYCSLVWDWDPYQEFWDIRDFGCVS